MSPANKRLKVCHGQPQESKPFRNLSATEQDALRKIAIERTFAAGDQIFKEGDAGDGIYVVKEGSVEISAAISQNVRRAFAKLGPGEML